MTTRLDYLYRKGIYEEELRKFVPHPQALSNSLQIFRLLQQRQSELIFGELTETQLEQSFNEQVFCRIFGYDSQFMQSAGQFHVLPKVYQRKQYNDLSLGYRLGRSQFISRATVELKGPNVNLEDGAIAQAFKYARTASSVDWIIVCNFKELVLFDKTDDTKCLHFDLNQITNVGSVRRILFPISMGAFFDLNGRSARLKKVQRRVNVRP